MKFSGIDVTTEPLIQQQIDELRDFARGSIWLYPVYLLVLGMFLFSVYMSFMDSQALSYWHIPALASFFLIATFFVRDVYRQEVRIDLAPLEEHYLTLLGQLFEGDLAPEVQRYRAQVISQGRDFTIGECKALRAFNLQWSLERDEAANMAALRARVYGQPPQPDGN
nr:hypothetical protein [Pseudomonas aeruginosa]